MNKFFDELGERIETVIGGYSKKCDIKIDDDWYILKLQEELGELTSAYLKTTSRGRQVDTKEALRENLEHETADVLGLLLLFARRHNIDLEKAMSEKWFKYLEK